MIVDLTGQRFGLLVAVARAGSNRNGSLWRCRCDCGKERNVIGSNLRKGNSRSCGCIRNKGLVERSKKHGHGGRGKHSAEYRTWRGMLARCRDKDYPGYGADGIEVCARWEFGENGMHGFECFFADMGTKPSHHHSIERKNSSGGYEPDNCRWAIAKEQARNRRTSRYVTVRGMTMTVAEAAERYGVNYGTLQYRLNQMGLDADRAVAA